MDGGGSLTGPAREVRLRFGPDLRLSALVFLLGVVALVLAVTAGDGTSRLLFGLATLVLVGYSLGDVLFWPRLTVDAGGLRIRTPLDRADVTWAEIEAVRADVHRRHGLRSVSLEVDAGERLVVFSRRALGADPETVAGIVRSLDPRGR